MFEINQEIFLTIAQEQNLSRAAEKLFISQSSLSRYLAKLENELGTILFDRTSNPLELTTSGQIFLDYILKCKEDYQVLLDRIDASKGKGKLRLRIGVGRWRGMHILPDTLPELYKCFPNADIRLFEGAESYMNSLLSRGQIDVAVINTPFHDCAYRNEIICPNEKILIAVNADHPMIKDIPKDEKWIDFHLLKKERIIVLRSELNLYKAVKQFYASQGITNVNELIVSNCETAANLVLENTGIAFYASFGLMNRRAKNDGIRFFEIGNPVLTWPLAVAYPNNYSPTEISEMFVDIVKQKYSICT